MILEEEGAALEAPRRPRVRGVQPKRRRRPCMLWTTSAVWYAVAVTLWLRKEGVRAWIEEGGNQYEIWLHSSGELGVAESHLRRCLRTLEAPEQARAWVGDRLAPLVRKVSTM